MRLSMIPIPRVLQDNEAFFLKFDKGALGSAFRYAQRLDRFIHRQPHGAIVAAPDRDRHASDLS